MRRRQGAAAAATVPPRRTLPVAGGRQVLAELWSALAGSRAGLVPVLVLFVLAALVALALPLLIGAAVDAVGAGDHASLWWLLGALLGTAVVSGVLEWLSVLAMSRRVEPVLARLRERFVVALLHLPRQRIDAAGGGDVLSRATADVTELSENAASILPRLVSLVFTLAAVGLGLGVLDLRYLVAAVVVVPLIAWTLRWYLRTGPDTYAAERRAAAERGRHVVDTFRAEATVRAYRLERRQLARVRHASWVHVRWAMRTRIVQNVLMARVRGTELVGLLMVLVAATWIALGGDATAGELTAGILLFLRIMEPAAELLFIADDLQAAASALGRVVGISRLQPAPATNGVPGCAEARGDRGTASRNVAVPRARTGEEPVPASGDGTRGRTGAVPPAPVSPSPAPLVSLHGVGFHYDDGPEVLHDIDLQLWPGCWVAVVGATGSGKSTLAGVVSGLWEPSAGRRRGGIPRHGIATVTQENHVFATTLRENLTLATGPVPDARVLGTLRLLGAENLVEGCPEGLDTLLGRTGHALDPASSQQLALARVALADPQLAVLDEATAEAGSADAQRLETTAAAVLAGRAALVVAHRLSQAAVCDQILVLDDGRVIERGSHAELVTAGGRYARLWAAWSSRG